MVFSAIVTGLSLANTFLNYRNGRKASRAQEYAYRENAADLREIVGLNADAILRTGNVNANAVLTVAEANATAVERATERQGHMYAIQAEEDRRRHVLAEKMHAGGIRVIWGGAGVQTNTETPLKKLHAEVKIGLQERRWGDIKTYWSLRNIYETGADKAEVIRITGDAQAEAILANAAIQAEVTRADGERQARAMERGAEVARANAPDLLSTALNIGGQIAQFGASGGFDIFGTTGNYNITGFTDFEAEYGVGGGSYSTPGGFNTSPLTYTWGGGTGYGQ